MSDGAYSFAPAGTSSAQGLANRRSRFSRQAKPGWTVGGGFPGLGGFLDAWGGPRQPLCLPAGCDPELKHGFTFSLFLFRCRGSARYLHHAIMQSCNQLSPGCRLPGVAGSGCRVAGGCCRVLPGASPVAAEGHSPPPASSPPPPGLSSRAPSGFTSLFCSVVLNHSRRCCICRCHWWCAPSLPSPA
jgi:hypothetical protein